MSRLMIRRPSVEADTLRSIGRGMARRMEAGAPGGCMLEPASAFLRLCAAQSCGKCVPCRIGLANMADLIDKALGGRGSVCDLATLEYTAQTVRRSADCAIGFEAGRLAEECVEAFREDFASHVETGSCTAKLAPTPCIEGCPAQVDIPAYIALAKAGRLAEAVRVIRNDNPFPSVCAYVCEHPCEQGCRRAVVDSPVNIRAIKKYVVEGAGTVPVPQPQAPTGRRVAVVGGGPSGLTAAYYLSLMGHGVTVYEQNEGLGGMLLYGIPRYRLPAEALNRDIDAILSTGVRVETGIKVGDDIPAEELARRFDAVYVAIGAHGSKRLGIEGEGLPGVFSAVEVLHGSSGRCEALDFEGKDVVVIGGGNVAMDAARTARRLGASSVKCVYRRRKEDMTALDEEIEFAVAEDCELMTLMAPLAIRRGFEKPLALEAQPQIPGSYAWGRPKPVPASCDAVEIPCDVIIAAVGQDIESTPFGEAGMPTEKGLFRSAADTSLEGLPKVFAGGDCAAGPETVIRAVEAGKVAAANIDEYLGFSHDVHDRVDVPAALFGSNTPCGRIDAGERPPRSRVLDFSGVEKDLTPEEASQESGRCLRCDYYGFSAFRERGASGW